MTTNEMWGGRFARGPAAIMEDINVSIGVDQRLYAQDIAASKAHARMLADRGIIAQNDAKAINEGLDKIKAEIDQGQFTFSAGSGEWTAQISVRDGQARPTDLTEALVALEQGNRVPWSGNV